MLLKNTSLFMKQSERLVLVQYCKLGLRQVRQVFPSNQGQVNW